MSRSARDAPDIIHLPPPRPRRTRGRRKAVNPATATIELRMPPDRKAAIHDAAKRSRMTMTRYVLSHLPDAEETAPVMAAADPVILTKLLGQVGHLGGNWNQMTADRNMAGREPEVEELREIRVVLVDMRDILLRALGR